MARTGWTFWERDPAKRAENAKKGRAYMFRLRWFYTLMAAFSLWLMGGIVWQERAHWPSLLHIQTWLHPFTGRGLQVFVLLIAEMFWFLHFTWMQAEQHKREQAAEEQERRMRDAAHEPGVWPPPPNATP